MTDTRHLPSRAAIDRWPEFTADAPMRVLVSACLTGVRCGSDGTSYGAPFEHTARLLALPNVECVIFCPEEFAFGTPRAVPDIHGGDGFDVLDRRARVVSATGVDWTEPMLRAANVMLALAKREAVQLAVLMDISAACGSQVIYRGARAERIHQPGQGVCAALLIRHGIPVISQRDLKTLGRVMHKLDDTFEVDPAACDHHETEWYIEHLGR